MSEEKKIDLSRRSFLNTTTVAAGAAAALPISRSAYAAGSGELKVGLVGCGGRGTGALDQTLSNSLGGVKCVAIADAFMDKCEGTVNKLKKKHGDKMAVNKDSMFAGFDAYKKVIDLCDVVLLVTSPGFRPMMFEAAVAAGKHVFMEKPVATDMPGIRKVLAAAKKADEKNLKVVVGLQRRYQKTYLETFKQIKDGMVGDIVSGRVQWNGGGVWTRDRATLEKQKGGPLTEMEYQMRNWYYFNWLCGDHITEQHVHNLDVANWFLGEEPIAAEGMGGREVRDNNPDWGEIFDHHYVAFEYASGAVIHSQCRHIKGCSGGVWESFVGTKGHAKVGRITDLKGETVWGYRGKGDPNPYQVEHNELYKAIREDLPLNNAHYGATSTRNAIMGRLATYGGKRITTEQAMKSTVGLFPDGPLAWDTMPKVVPGENGLYPSAVPGRSRVI